IPPVPRTRGHHTRCPPRSAVLVPFVALQSFSQSSCDKKGVGGLLQAPDLAVSQCPGMGESGLHPPPLVRNAEIASENDHVIAQLEVLVPFRVELVEVGKEREEIVNNHVDTAIDAPVGEAFGNIILEVIRQERFENIHVSPGAVQFPDQSDLRRIRHANPPQVDVDGPLESDTQVGKCRMCFVISCSAMIPSGQSATCSRSLATSRAVSDEALAPKRAVT